MRDGTEVKGYLRDPNAANSRDVERLSGRTVVEGYPAALDLSMTEIGHIDVSGPPGAPSLAVTHTNGKVTSPVTGAKFAIDGGDSRTGATEVTFLSVTTQGTTIEVPLSDIAEVSVEGETISVQTAAGKSLAGGIASLVLRGKTNALGRAGDAQMSLRAVKRLVLSR